mmetsp:Transcript_17654/g.15569  ORF Transcript_17654/g.15569 Transcript_17654/m.15569 type:complete len:113 (+) Transcript_17654:312-650(+)
MESPPNEYKIKKSSKESHQFKINRCPNIRTRSVSSKVTNYPRIMSISSPFEKLGMKESNVNNKLQMNQTNKFKITRMMNASVKSSHNTRTSKPPQNTFKNRLQNSVDEDQNQ